MRNLLALAIAFQVQLTTEDVRELGYNVADEDFKGYFGIDLEATERKDEKFNIDDLEGFMSEEEILSLPKEEPTETAKKSSKKESKAETTEKVEEAAKEESTASTESDTSRSDLEKELAAKEEELSTCKNANTKKKLAKEIEVLKSEIEAAKTPEEKETPAQKRKRESAAKKEADKKAKDEAKAIKDKEKADKKAAKDAADAANPKVTLTKAQKWEKLVEDHKHLKEGQKVTFVDYKTKAVIPATFKKHGEFSDKMPAAIVTYDVEDPKDATKTKLKSRAVSYPMLTLLD